MSKIVQIADIHFGTENPRALEAFEATLAAIDADAIAVCGDLTQRGKRSEFEASRAWLDRFDLPKLVVAGNHDTPLLNLYERVVSPFDRHDDYYQDLSDPVVLDNAVLVGINTSRGWQTRKNWAEGSVNLEQLEDAISLCDAFDQRTCFLVCHHPFLSPPDAPMRTATRRGRRSSRRLAQSRFRFLLTGHVHVPSVTVIDHDDDAYIAVSCGTLSTRIRSSPASFNLIDISGENCVVTVFSLHGDRFVPQPPHVLTPDFNRAETHIGIDQGTE